MNTAHAVEAGSHGPVWEVSHHPIHSASEALHWMFDENAHETHPHIRPRHYTFIELAACSREMERL